MAGFKHQILAKVLEEVDEGIRLIRSNSKQSLLNLHLNEKFRGKFKSVGHRVNMQIEET